MQDWEHSSPWWSLPEHPHIVGKVHAVVLAFATNSMKSLMESGRF